MNTPHRSLTRLDRLRAARILCEVDLILARENVEFLESIADEVQVGNAVDIARDDLVGRELAALVLDRAIAKEVAQ